MMVIPTHSQSECCMSNYWVLPSGLLILTILFSFTGYSHSTTNSTQCPVEIKPQQSLLEKDEGWTVSTENTRNPLVSIRISEGNPTEMAWLIPTKTSNPSVLQWLLPKSERGYWVACGYGSTSLILFRPIPRISSRCTVWLDKDFSPPIATKYECKQKIQRA